MSKPRTEAGRRLLAQLDGRPGPVSHGEILAIEREAFWDGVKSVEEVHQPEPIESVEDLAVQGLTDAERDAFMPEHR